MMKIVLAAGIFYPDVGGPAIHSRKIAEALCAAGHDVVVVAYGSTSEPDKFPFAVRRISRSWPSFLRWPLYFFKVFIAAFGSKIIYAFDLTAAGLPALITAKILRKKFLIRIGGDPIWERIVETGERFLSIKEYYNQRLHLVDKPLLFRFIKLVLSGADQIVTYSPFLSAIYEEYFYVPTAKIKIILNPVFRREKAEKILQEESKVLFAGRFVSYKNLPFLIRVFDKIRSRIGKGELVLIGHGPEKTSLENLINNLPSARHIKILPSLTQEKLFEEIRSATVCVGPALTEFNPNFILESLSLGKPVLLSRENGLTVQLPEEFLFEARDEKEFEKKLEKFFDPSFYQKAVKMVEAIPMEQTWEKVIEQHLGLINKEIAKR